MSLKGPDLLQNSFKFSIDSDASSLKKSILNHLRFTLARHPESAKDDEWWTATCFAIRDHLVDRFMHTVCTY